MPEVNRYDEVVAEELSKVGVELKSERYAHETNDEYAYRLVAVIEDAIDEHESEIAHLDQLRTTVRALT